MTDRDQVTWKYVVGVAGTVILLSLGITGWLLTKGYENLIEVSQRIEKNQEKTVAEFAKRCGDNEQKNALMARRMDRQEILIVVPFEKRIELLKNLQRNYPMTPTVERNSRGD